MYIQIRSKQELEELRTHIKSIGLLPNKGPFFRQKTNIAYPLYYQVDENFEFLSWQTCSLDDNITWKGTQYEKNYNTGLPLIVYLNPSAYPEYFI